MAQWGITGLKYFSHLTFGSGYFDFPGVCVMVPQTCYSAVEDLYNHIYIYSLYFLQKKYCGRLTTIVTCVYRQSEMFYPSHNPRSVK